MARSHYWWNKAILQQTQRINVVEGVAIWGLSQIKVFKLRKFHSLWKDQLHNLALRNTFFWVIVHSCFAQLASQQLEEKLRSLNLRIEKSMKLKLTTPKALDKWWRLMASSIWVYVFYRSEASFWWHWQKWKVTCIGRTMGNFEVLKNLSVNWNF